MNITNEEKEALYAEFKERLENENKEQINKLTYFGFAYKHFKELYHKNLDTFKGCLFSRDAVPYRDWDKIRLMVCHVYGCSTVTKMPIDKMEEANELAIELIDIIFENNKKILEEKYKVESN